jgi:hypothetical protein
MCGKFTRALLSQQIFSLPFAPFWDKSTLILTIEFLEGHNAVQEKETLLGHQHFEVFLMS